MEDDGLEDQPTQHNRRITDLQREEIDVQREILHAINRWHFTTLWIAIVLTAYITLKLTGVE